MLVTALVLMLTLSIIFISSHDAFAQIKPKSLKVTLTKSVDKSVIQSGDPVIYKYVIKNSGTEGIRCFSLVDVPLGPIPIGSVLLAPDAEAMFTKPTTIDETTTNMAKVTCRNLTPAGTLVKADSNPVTVTVVHPSVTLLKTPSKTQVKDGQQITYDLKATNTSTDVDLDSCQISDPLLGGNIGGTFSLAKGGGMNTKTTGLVTINSPGLDNTATVKCNVPTTMVSMVSASASASVKVVDISGLILEKTPSKTQVKEGQQITYDLKATNTNVNFNLEDCQINDPLLGGNIGGTFSLAKGGGMNTKTTGLVTINSPGLDNTATVTCFEPVTMNNVDASDTASVKVVDISGLILEKTPSKTEVSDGEQITYDLKATNNNVNFDLENCQISDPFLGGNIGGTFSLAKGGGMNTETTDPITINSPGLDNTATVTCFEPVTMNNVMASDTASVIVKLVPSVDLVKKADPGVIESGESVKFTIMAINNGQTNLDDCNIVDDNGTPDDDSDDIDIDALMGGPFSLAPSQSKDFMYTVDEVFADRKNTAQIVCLDPDNNPVGEMSMAQVIVLFVGGEYLPIDSISLFIAGLQGSASWMVPAIAGVAGAGAYFIRTRMKQD